MPGNVSLTAGTKYWIVLQGGYTKSDTIYISWKADTTAATFSGGNVAYYVGSTATWTADTDDDFLFKLLENPAGSNYYQDVNNLKHETGQLSAIYYTNIKDIGYIADVRVMIEYIASVSQNLAWNSDATRKFDDSETLRFTGEEAPGALSFQIRTSSDNVTWSAWEDWITADYTCRYFQIKATFTRTSLSTEILLSYLLIKADLPDIDEFGDDTITVAADGKAILFTKTYHEIPSVNIDIISGNGYVHKFSVVPSLTGFTVKLYDMSAVAVTGDFRFHAHGI